MYLPQAPCTCVMSELECRQKPAPGLEQGTHDDGPFWRMRPFLLSGLPEPAPGLVGHRSETTYESWIEKLCNMPVIRIRKMLANWLADMDEPADVPVETLPTLESCVHQLLEIRLDADDADIVVDCGPLQDMPRLTFVRCWMCLKRSRLSLAAARSEMNDEFWKVWRTIRETWQQLDDECFAGLTPAHQADLKRAVLEAADTFMDDDQSVAACSFSSAAPQHAEPPVVYQTTTWMLTSVFAPGAAPASVVTAKQNRVVQQGPMWWTVDESGSAAADRLTLAAMSPSQAAWSPLWSRFHAAEWDNYTNMGPDASTLGRRLPQLLNRHHALWRHAGDTMIERHDSWHVHEKGRFAWNKLEAKVVKHAHRCDGEGHVCWISGRRTRHRGERVWRPFCQTFRFNLGSPIDNVSDALVDFLQWMFMRRMLMVAVSSIRPAEHTVDSGLRNAVLSSTEDPVGSLVYVRLRDGADPADGPPPDTHEWGYHATSMYCLHRAIAHRHLNAGPGQLELNGRRMLNGIYYHRSWNSCLCLQNFNHYIALKGGPWFYAPVLVLAVNRNPTDASGGLRATDVRGIGVTYEDSHRIVGFYMHIMHAADVRFNMTSQNTAVCEGAWAAALELPADGTWDNLLMRSYRMRNKPLA